MQNKVKVNIHFSYETHINIEMHLGDLIHFYIEAITCLLQWRDKIQNCVFYFLYCDCVWAVRASSRVCSCEDINTGAEC